MEVASKALYRDVSNGPNYAKILILVTAGGKTNASPLLEIGEILAQRGYRMEFATLDGFQEFVEGLEWVQKTHILGPGVPLDVEENEYLKMSQWEGNAWGPIMEVKKFLDSSWSDVYPSLSKIMRDPDNRPDFILSDYLVDAARDMFEEYGVPIALHWPQMPTMMMPAGYIPGYAGLQTEVLTSENATILQRIKNELAPLVSLPNVIKYKKWVKEMRAAQGVTRPLALQTKPNHLTLINSFWGIEVPKDIPPNVVPVGPILADSYPGLESHPKLVSFLESHKRTLYISLGTHVLLTNEKLRRIIEGTITARNMGWIDGVVWAIRGMARKQLDLAAPVPGKLVPQPSSVGALLDGAHEDFYFLEFAPQRAMLDHPSVAVFFTHGGASSTNEVAWHGARVIAMGIYFDQLQNMMRLRDAGVGIPMNKSTFTSTELAKAIGDLAMDPEGKYAYNTKRLKGIARVASKRKHLAADKVEEVLCNGSDLHLQPADVRMPIWKARNYDLWGILGAGILLTLALTVALPVAIVEATR